MADKVNFASFVIIFKIKYFFLFSQISVYYRKEYHNKNKPLDIKTNKNKSFSVLSLLAHFALFMITKWPVVRHKWFAYQTKPKYLYFNMQTIGCVFYGDTLYFNRMIIIIQLGTILFRLIFNFQKRIWIYQRSIKKRNWCEFCCFILIF